MRTVHLHGRLARFGDKFDLEVDTVGDAIRGLCCNFKSFGDELKKGAYHIVRGDPETGLSLDLGDVNSFKLGSGDLHIIPVVEGSKGRGGAVLKIVLGVALMGAAIFFAPAAATFGASMTTSIAGGAIGGLTYGNLAMIGLAITLSGVSQMLTSPKENEEKDEESFFVNGPGNAYEQGSPVPLVYGEVITGGVLISAGMDIENIGTYQG